MGKFGNRMISFLSGRYGMDNFYRFLMVVSFVMLFINVFVRSLILYALILLLIGYMTFRSMSRNRSKRYAENAVYLKIRKKITAPFVLLKNRIRDRKTHKYVRCRSCKAVIRVPKVSGEHSLKCPKCGKSMPVIIK